MSLCAMYTKEAVKNLRGLRRPIGRYQKETLLHLKKTYSDFVKKLQSNILTFQWLDRPPGKLTSKEFYHG